MPKYSQILCQSFSTIFTNMVPIIHYNIHKYCANHSLQYSQILCQSFSTVLVRAESWGSRTSPLIQYTQIFTNIVPIILYIIFTNFVPIILYNIHKYGTNHSTQYTHKYCANHSLQSSHILTPH
jgi:hypothetical protein